MQERHPARRLAVFLFLALFGTQAFIGPTRTAENSNVITRIALALAIVQDGSLRIDRFAPHTRDKAEQDGHFYADKAPGSSLLAVPLVALLDAAWRVAGATPTSNITYDAAGDDKFPIFYIACVWAASLALSAVAAALAAATMLGLAMRLGASQAAAWRVAAAFGFGTPILWWGTTYFGHSLSAAMLLLGFSRIVTASTGDGGHERRDGLLSGLLLAGSVVVELIAAPAALAIGVFGLARLARLPRSRGLALVGWTVLGALPVALVLMAYNWAALGGPFELGYGKVVGFEGMHQGLFGVSLPRLSVLVELLVGPARGLLWISPFLALAPLGVWAAWRRMPRDVVVLCVVVPLCFLAINSGYAYWTGGYSTGPRHLTAGLAFACLPLAALWDQTTHARAGWLWRGVIDQLIILSVAMALICANVDPTSPTLAPGHSPLLEHILPMLLQGDVGNVLTGMRKLTGMPAVPAPVTLLALPLIWAAAWVMSRWLVPRRYA